MSVSLSAEGRERIEQFRRDHRTTLATMLFTDIEGSTRLKQTLGDRAAVRLILKHNDLVRSILRDFPEGREIDTTGDSFFIVFARPSDAVRFALLLQSKIRTGLGDAPLRTRIGIHLGEVFVAQSGNGPKPVDFFGTHVDTAARVMSIAKGDQILCTRFVFDSARQILRGQEMSGLGPLVWMSHGEYRLKGVDEPVEICEVGEKDKAVLAPPPDGEKAWRQVRGDEEEMCGWRPAAGQVVPNTDWVLTQRLGEGGFGETWKAEHRVTKDLRAFKFCFKANRVRGLKREVTLFRVLRQKTGEYQPFVRLYDVNLQRPPYYLVMEYVEGPNLNQWVEEERTKGRPIGLEQKLEILARVAEALALAHSAGVVHNDVKPSNVLMAPDQQTGGRYVKIADFGVGQILAQERVAQLGITMAGFTQAGTQAGSGTVSGSQIYMAPELLMGKAPSPQSDFYSLGVMLYQLYREDMGAALPADWEEHIRDPIIRADLRWLLAGDAQRRPADGCAVAARLRQYLKRKRIRRLKLWLTSLLAASAFFILVLAGYAAWQESVTREKLIAAQQSYFANIASAQQNVRDSNFAEAEVLLAQCPPHLRHWEWGRLKYLCHLDLQTLKGHSDDVNCIAVSPDGKWIASGSLDSTVKIWDAHSGLEVRSLAGYSDSVECVAFSPDGKRLATGAADGSIKIWDVVSGQPIFFFPQARELVACLAFSPDGRRLASVSGRCLQVWDATTGRALAPPVAGQSLLSSVAFSHSGRWVAYGSLDGIVRVLDGETARQIHERQTEAGAIWALGFSPDDKRLAAGSGADVCLWDLVSEGPAIILRGHSAGVETLAFSPDGQLLATGSEDQTIRIWAVSTGRETLTLRGHSSRVNSVAFTPDGSRLISGGMDGVVKVWDARETREFRRLRGAPDLVVTCAYSPDGRRLAASVLDGTLRVWDAETGEPVPPYGGRIKGHAGAAWCVNFSPDGKRLVSCGDDRTVRLWDSQSGKEIITLRSHTAGVNSVAFSPNGKFIISGSDDKTAILWEADTGKEIRRLIGHTNAVECVAFSRDGGMIATGSMDETILLWQVETGRRVRVLEGHTQPIFSVDFSPDGKRLVSAGMEKKARVWDVKSGRELFALAGHSDVVICAAFSPDGKRIATGSRDRTVKLWDSEQGRELIGLKGHQGLVTSVCFRPDCCRIASSSEDRSVIVWPAQDWTAISPQQQGR